MTAAVDGDMRTLLQLLTNGAEVNARDNRGGTALMYAIRRAVEPDASALCLGAEGYPACGVADGGAGDWNVRRR